MGIVVGEINLGKTKKIICSIENYGGNDYASIRIWINSPTFIGPTTSGLITSGLILDKDKTRYIK